MLLTVAERFERGMATLLSQEHQGRLCCGRGEYEVSDARPQHFCWPTP